MYKKGWFGSGHSCDYAIKIIVAVNRIIILEVWNF